MLLLRTGWRCAAASRRAPAALAAAAALALGLGAAPPAAAQVVTALTLSTSRPSASTDQPITFTAAVAPAGPLTGVPTGTVTFLDGGAPLGQAALDAGAASLTVRSLPKGLHAITAAYAGDGLYLATEGALPGGQPVADSPPVAGAGQAVAFDGLGQHARVEDPGGALDGALTVELWFEAAAVQGADPACLVQQGEGDGLRFGLCLGAALDRLIVRRGFETTTIPVAIGPGWHHLALSAGPVDTLVLLDGAVFTPLLGALRARQAQPLVLGGAPAGAGAADLFAGRVDELRLWAAPRSAGELEAWARQPVAGGAAGLLGLWRMDEGSGGTLFDAAPAHLEARLAAPGLATWGPSAAWRRRVIGAPRRLAPFLAGYDADGDPFTVSVPVPASHGLASAAAGAASYDPATEFSGLDAFTCEVAGGGATSRYLTEVEVPAPVACTSDAACSGGGACVAGACVAPDRLRTEGGAYGCATGGGPGGTGGAPGAGLAAAALAVLALAPRRRRRAGAALLAALGLAAPARAAEGFAVRTVETAPAGDRFLAVPGAAVEGHLALAASLGLGWTERPLVLTVDGAVPPGGTLIERQLTRHLGVSLALRDRLLVEAAWPVSLLQVEQRPSGAAPSGSATEDPRLGARLVLLGDAAFAVAAGLTAWLPLGQPERFGSDGALRLQPALLAGGRDGALAWAAEAGLLLRRRRTTLSTEVGPAATGRAAVGWLVLGGRLQVGPELVARAQLGGGAPLGLDVLASARWSIAPGWSLAGAVGTRHGNAAPGSPPVRALVELAWRADLSPRAAAAPPEPDAPEVVVAAAAVPEPQPAAPEPPAPLAPPAEPAPPAPPPAPEPAPVAAAPAPEPDVARPAPVPVPVRAPPPPRPPPAPPPPAWKGPVPPAVVAGGVIRIDQRITFDHDSARLEPRSLPVLEAVARVMLADPRLSRVVVVGHTDGAGPRDANLALSRARAEAVREHLIRRGVAAERLQSRGHGPDRPIADNQTEAGREANRRVEFLIATIGER